jgi:ribosomal protein S18 acetylase RimI-like enzyme
MAASDAAADADAPPILLLRPHDVDGVAPLSVEAGWNQIAADWRLMIAAGSAFGIQDGAGRWIATALALPLGPQVSWVSMVLVAKAERRQGHGTRLLRRCFDAIEATGGAMGLDATEFGRPVYLPLGFRDVYAVSRWSTQSAVDMTVAPPPGLTIRPARARDLERIAEFDRRCSGLERRVILENLHTRAPQLAHVAERADGSLAGYSLGRDGHRAPHVGPVVAETQAIGLALVSQALAGVGSPSTLDVPDRQGEIRRWLLSQGASVQRGFMRMLRGSAPAVEDGTRIMAIAGPELA